MNTQKSKPENRTEKMFQMDECPPGSLMDRINRRCRGEDVEPIEEDTVTTSQKEGVINPDGDLNVLSEDMRQVRAEKAAAKGKKEGGKALGS